MSKKTKNYSAVSLNIFLLFALTITLYFNSQIQDPFNSPKQWILLAFSSILVIPALISCTTIKLGSFYFKFLLVLSFFSLSLFISTLMTDNWYVAFFGDTQRKLGFLTYLSFIVIILYAAFKLKFQSVQKFITTMIILGFIFASYGQLQNNGKDFVSWNNPYNSIIGTLGNPNYAAALMAIMGVASFGYFFSNSASRFLRLFALFNSLYILYTIYLSNARQGLISYLLGISIILCYIIYYKNKTYGFIALSSIIVLGIFSILGMLQIGPFSQALYKTSLTIRGYYWSAGVEMFKANPLLGVGIDRYGYNFREFRNVNYPLNYGFDITSTNAHNVFIQFFATGGFFVGIAYLALTILIMVSGLRSITISANHQKIIPITIFASWAAFQAQSVISIDNIGLTIWGWILGGLLIGMYAQFSDLKPKVQVEARSNKSLENSQLLNIVVSTILMLFSVILISTQYRGEKNAFEARLIFDGNVEDRERQVYRTASETFIINLNDPTYKMASAYYMAVSGFKDEGIERLKEVVKSDPKNFDALDLLASISEQVGLTNEAIQYRVTISKIDPWNAKNYLRLGNLYKFQGDYQSMRAVRDKILSYAANTTVGNDAILELN